MFIARLRRKTQIRRRKCGRETLTEDAVRFQDIVVSKTQERGVTVPNKLLRELQRGSDQPDGGKRLYKLDLRRTHLSDAHVEALTEALQELPVVRKLDLRGNDALTTKALNALDALLKGQVELFRLVQADASLADSSLSFLYSVKLDTAVLSLDRTVAEELQARTAALEVADSVLDVRHAFFEADIRESGTLTEHELSDAMRAVMGLTPKAGETSRVLRFFGQPGTEGRSPTVITLGGFEAAMAGRLRESHTLPVLPQGRDDILFGSAEDAGDQDHAECFSPWSTRSFGATTGGIGGKGGIGSGGSKRSPLSASQDLRSAAGMRTRGLPPWRGDEGRSELDRTKKDSERGGEPGAAETLGNIFGDDDDGDGSEEEGQDRHAATPGRGGERSQPVFHNGNGSGSGEESRYRRGSSGASGAGSGKGAKDDRDRVAKRENEFERRGLSAQESGEMSNSIAGASCLGVNSGGGMEDSALTDCSSDDDLSYSSPRPQGSTSSRLRNQHPAFSSRQAGADDSPKTTTASLSDWRRHSSGSTPAARGVEAVDTTTETVHGRKNVCFAERPVSEGRRVSDTPLSSRPEDCLAGADTRSGASTYKADEPQSGLKGGESDGDASGRSSGDSNPASAQQRGCSVAGNVAPSPASSALATNETMAPGGGFPPGENGEALTETAASNPALSLSDSVGSGGEASPPLSHRRRATAIADQVRQQTLEGEATPSGGASPGVEVVGGGDADVLDVPTKTATAHGVTREGTDCRADGGALDESAILVDLQERVVGETPSVSCATSATAASATTCLEADFGTNEKMQGGEETDNISAAGDQHPPGADSENSQHVSPSFSSEQQHGEHRPSAATTASAESKGAGEGDKLCSAATAAANAVQPSAGSEKERGSLLDGPAVSTPKTAVAALSGTTTEPMQAVLVTTSQAVKGGGDLAAAENNRNASIGKLEGSARPSLEAITEAPGGESSGDSYSGGSRGGVTSAVVVADAAPALDSQSAGVTMRKPFCLSPTNVVRQSRGSGTTCRERERIAARIQLSAGMGVSASAAAAPSAKGVAPDLLPPSSSVTGGGFDGGFTTDSGYGGGGDGGGSMSASGSPASHIRAGRPATSPSFARRASSPDREERGGRWLMVGGGGATVENGQCSSPSPSSRFHLPSSETKTAPLCGAGGSTSLYDGSVTNATRSTTGARGREGAWCFSIAGSEAAFSGCGGGGQESTETIAGGEVKNALPRVDEEQLALRLSEGVLDISRGGLAKMGAVLQLETVYGCGRDSLIGLHTLVLSYNQLQVLDMSVLTTMPALRHLDVSHNLLCRMEPMDGRDLPPRLESLNMSHNRISRIGGIGQCFLLRVVDLRHNHIKRVQGLEHLSLLEQLDLGNNLISKAASARALSFNRSLKLLWLEGNPLAEHPRYRPTLTCLLPHVRAVDSRGMPPSSDSDQRRWPATAGGGSVGEGGENGGLNGTATGMGRGEGGHRRGCSSNFSVSREWQAGQDERRSKEWRQVMEWRKDQARREEEAKAPGKGHEPRQAINAAQQRRQAEELARPRPRTCPSEEAISKAKSMACDRPAVVFGISYRGERDGDRKIAGDTAYHASSPASAAVESAPPPPPPPPPPASEQQQTERQQQRQRQQQEDLSGAWAEEYEQHGRLDGGVGGGREEGEVGCFGDSLGCRELMSSRFLRDDSRPLWETRHGGGNTLPSPQTERMEADKDPLANANGGRGERGHAVTSPRDGGSNSAESSQVESKRNELVESWLLDVRLETETAGTALRVLLKMCKERGRHGDEKRRLSSFRTALEGMGLFSPQHGPVPTSFVGEEGHALALKVTAAARQVAMTKAAVKNMLRLMESAESGEEGSAEVDQYADFIRQQREIVVGGGDRTSSSSNSPRARREGAATIESMARHADTPGATHHPGAPSSALGDAVGDAVGAAATLEILEGTRGSTSATSENTLDVVADRRGGQEKSTTDTDRVEQQPERREVGQGLDVHDGAGSVKDNSPKLPYPEGSANQTTAVAEEAAGSLETSSPPLDPVTAATNPVLVPAVDKVEEQTEIAPHTPSTSLVDPGDPTGDSTTRGSGRTRAAESSIDALTSGRMPDDRGSTSGDPTKGNERGGHPDGEGDGNTETTERPSPVHLATLADAAATPATATPSLMDGQLLSSPPQTNAGGVLSGDDVEGDDAGETAAAVAPAAEPAAGREDKDAAVLSVSGASPAVAAPSSASLSARERLLRHVRVETSPHSDDSSCSSGSDRVDGDAQQPTADVAQPEPGGVQVQQGGGEGGAGGGATGEEGGGDHDTAVSPSAAEQEAGTENPSPGKAGNLAAGRPLTARPRTRRQEGGGKRGERGDDDVEPAAPIDTSGDGGVPSIPSTVRLTTDQAEAEAARGSTEDPSDDDAVQHGEHSLGVGSIPKNDAGESIDAAVRESACDKDNGGQSAGYEDSKRGANGQSGSARPQEDEDTSPPSGAAVEVARDGEAVGDPANNSGDEHLGAPALDETEKAEENGEGHTPNPPVPGVATAALPDTVESEDGIEDKCPPEEVEVAGVIGTDTAPGKGAAESDRNDSATKDRGDKESAKAEGNGGGDSDTKANGADGETVSTGAAGSELAWIEGYDPGHDCYYYHHVPTGESRWYKPDEPYEPYVHSDEDEERDEEAFAAAVDEAQATGRGSEDDDDRRRETKRQSKDHGRRRDDRRGDDRRGDDRRGDDRGGDGRRRSKDSSRRKREKTALERLNELTDDNSYESGDLRFDDGGGGSRRQSGSSRRGSKGSRRRRSYDEDGHHRSSSSRRRRKEHYVEGNDAGSHSRRRSSKSSSGRRKSRHDDDDDDDASPDGSGGGARDEDPRRRASSVARSESRRRSR